MPITATPCIPRIQNKQVITTINTIPKYDPIKFITTVNILLIGVIQLKDNKFANIVIIITTRKIEIIPSKYSIAATGTSLKLNFFRLILENNLYNSTDIIEIIMVGKYDKNKYSYIYFYHIFLPL